MNQVRVHGDPVGDSAMSAALRAFVRLAHDSGLRCALAALDGSAVSAAGELACCLAPAVASTAPVLVFAPPASASAAVLTARRRWPRACAVLGVAPGVRAEELLGRVRAELRWAGVEDPPDGLAERELAPWLALATPRADGPIVAVHDGDAASHVAVVFDVWKRQFAPTGRCLRIVATSHEPMVRASVADLVRGGVPAVEVVSGPFVPDCVDDAAVVVLPWARPRPTRDLVLALASGRPVCVPTLPPLMHLLAPGAAAPIRAGAGELDQEAVAAALAQALAGGAAIGRRARTFVHEELTRERPAAPPLPIGAAAAVIEQVVELPRASSSQAPAQVRV
jgi:hypothetical protein